MWLELGVTLGTSLGIGWLASHLHGPLSVVPRVVATLPYLTFLWRSAVWAERVARRKGIYHPQYFVLGPLGLVKALLARDKARSTPR